MVVLHLLLPAPLLDNRSISLGVGSSSELASTARACHALFAQGADETVETWGDTR